MTGAQLFHEMLLEAGVEVLFGFPGGSVLPIFDALYQTPIRFVLTRHEQGAAHMADGYARSTGRVGVCIATSGPGATNLVTGLATAFMDSVPVVALTGQVVSNLIGNDAFQEADTTGITRPITKHNMLVKRVEDLGRSIREAFHIASTGRPGPVVVDIAKDATMATLEAEPKLEMDLPGYKPVTAGHMRQIKAAAEMINESRKPVLYVGGGVIIAEASEDLRALVDKGKFPVTTTLMAMGAIDETDPLALQMLGMHGSAAANYAVQECDCLVAVGARFDDRVTGRIETFAPQAKIIHIDIDPASISKTVVVDVPVVGDARDILRRLLPLINPVRRPGWLKQIAGWKRQFPFSYALGERIKPQAVVEAIGRLTAHDAIVTTGVGQHQMWTAQYYGWRRPRQLITSGGLGTMGFGLPAAIGAQFGNPGRTVIDIDGDGSFAMTVGELVTAVQYHQPVKVVVLDNHYLGMVRQWQEMFYNRRYSATEHPCPDLPKLAEALGATGMRVTEPGEVDDAINQMLKTEGPVVLVAEVEPEENVFPMVASGKSLHEMDMGRLV
ncbi:MAG TPA: biosynthetic-type acetolactate synthase large subunit [Phycisphaerae bacterium]|nr:biosynthetic-type acetolactate synthase large subunit [Phycisphaerae bacterium]